MSTYFGVVKLRHVMVDPVNVEEAIVLRASVSQSRKELVETRRGIHRTPDRKLTVKNIRLL